VYIIILWGIRPTLGNMGVIVEYMVSVNFKASRELTADEVACLVGSIELQIQEPQDFDNEDALWSASHYSVHVGLVQ